MSIAISMEGLWIEEKLRCLEEVADLIPGIKIIQCRKPYQNLFICERGQETFGLDKMAFEQLSAEEYRKLIFDENGADTCLLGLGDNKTCSYPAKKYYIKEACVNGEQQIHLYVLHDFFPDSNGEPLLTMTQIIPIDFLPLIQNKIRRLVAEVAFRRKNSQKFQSLTKRTQEVFALMANLEKARDIGARLFIEPNTVNSHKKKIKEALTIKRALDIVLFGLAFDLIRFDFDANGRQSKKTNIRNPKNPCPI